MASPMSGGPSRSTVCGTGPSENPPPASVFPQRVQTDTGRAASTSSSRRISVCRVCLPTRHASGLLMLQTLSAHVVWSHGQREDKVP